MNGLPLSFNQEKSKHKNHIYKGVGPTHHTQHQKALNLDYFNTTFSDEDDPHWGPRPDP